MTIPVCGWPIHPCSAAGSATLISLRKDCKPRSSLCKHAFHHIEYKDSDVDVVYMGEYQLQKSTSMRCTQSWNVMTVGAKSLIRKNLTSMVTLRCKNRRILELLKHFNILRMQFVFSLAYSDDIYHIPYDGIVWKHSLFLWWNCLNNLASSLNMDDQNGYV